ncbi:MAG TPA: AraC family transcriptional regulator, partial [Polyangiales bacterium]|nr:AraC family transcriptional regulator [Polyangiales bacterium]
MSSDTLSEVLRSVRLTGAVFFKVEAAAPWVAESPASQAIAPHVMPGVEHVIAYHVAVRGSCWANLIGEPPIKLDEGDVVVFPHGDPHVMASAPGLRAPVNLQLYRYPEAGQLPIAVSINDTAGERALLVCGFLGCDARPFNPLLAALPRILHVPKQSGPEGVLLEQLVRVAVAESTGQSAGSECMLARLSELLFIEVVRRQVASLPGETTGWLAGLRDELCGRALSALHDRPAQPWTLELLAAEVGLSRSMLAERFHHYVGVPPMQYLARWRMQLAASLLTGTSLGLAQVAERVGYGSEAALSRAFKRLVGVAPSAWRDGARPSQGWVAPDE